jgi:hypothetical protein
MKQSAIADARAAIPRDFVNTDPPDERDANRVRRES